MARIEARCMNCGNVFLTADMIATTCANRGAAKRAFMCERCATTNQHYTSGRNTDAEFGKVENGIKCGIELETAGSTLDARNMLFRFGFVPTNDSSLNNTRLDMPYYGYDKTCEYVSGINHGMKRFTKQFIEIEKMLNTRQIAMNSSCGTHFHVSYNDMLTTTGDNAMYFITNYYKSIFGDMQKIMEENHDKTEKFFGRYFTDYAPKFDSFSHQHVNEYNERYCWVNLTNSTNIEFRLNKFVSAKQYTSLCMFEIWCVKTIMANFAEKYNTTTDKKTLAKKTGAKLAKKLAKIYAEM